MQMVRNEHGTCFHSRVGQYLKVAQAIIATVQHSVADLGLLKDGFHW